MTVPPQFEPPLLEMRGVGKDYRGVAALKDIDFDLRRGEVHAILGENGAGKSTLVKILSGAVTPTRGEIRLEGQRIQIAGPAFARRHGIAMVYQETSLVPTMTVAQNLYLGDEKFFNRLRGTYIEAQQFLQSLNFPVDPTAPVQSLGTAKRQMVEIARAVRLKAQDHHFRRADRDADAGGKASSLRVDRPAAQGPACRSSSSATRWRKRSKSPTGSPSCATAPISSPTTPRRFPARPIIRHMVGRSLTDELYGRAADSRKLRPAGEKVLSVQNLSMQNFVRNTSFSIFAGQVTGVFGLVGSGRTETARIIAGIAKRDFFHGGDVRFEGQVRALPDAARGGRRRRRLCHRGPQRRRVLRDDVGRREHLYRADFEPATRAAIVASMSETRTLAADWTKKLNIQRVERRLPGHRAFRRQSAEGGYRQGAGAEAEADHLRRADARRRRRRHRRNPSSDSALADEGLAVVVISSYLPEILSLSDRILVSRQGRIVEESSAG